jgi:cytochrome P450
MAEQTVNSGMAGEEKTAKQLLEQSNFFAADPQVLSDPYRFYQAANSEGPITPEPHFGVYLATRYRDILDIERRHNDFSACIAAVGPFAKGQVPERPDEAGCPFGKADLAEEMETWRETTKVDMIPVLTLDPPHHTEYRNLVNKLFTPQRKEQVTPRLRELAQELIDSFIADGEVEWIGRYSGPYTYFVMNEVMDFPRADEDVLRERFLQRHDGEGLNVRAQVATSEATTAPDNPLGVSDDRMRQYLTERRANPQNDVLSDIATARMADGTLPDVEALVGISSVMYGAGQVTTTDLIGNAMRFLAINPELQERLRDHPEEIELFVDEVLRIEPPVQGLFRYCVRDTEVNGTPVPAGAIIWMVYGAGNRDPEQFEDPDKFDPKRENAYQGIAFGAGRHFCPGQPLAKLEAKITIEEVFKRMKNIRLKDKPEDIKFHDWFVVRGPNEMNIQFEAVE